MIMLFGVWIVEEGRRGGKEKMALAMHAKMIFIYNICILFCLTKLIKKLFLYFYYPQNYINDIKK